MAKYKGEQWVASILEQGDKTKKKEQSVTLDHGPRQAIRVQAKDEPPHSTKNQFNLNVCALLLSVCSKHTHGASIKTAAETAPRGYCFSAHTHTHTHTYTYIHTCFTQTN